MRTNKKVALILDTITGAWFQLLSCILLSCIAVFFYIEATKVSTPEMKEFVLMVDERTTSEKDTLEHIALNYSTSCPLEDSMRIGNYNKYSVLDAEFRYRSITTLIDDVHEKGLQKMVVTQRQTGKVLLSYKWTKCLIAYYPNQHFKEEGTLSFPDTSKVIIHYGKGEQRVSWIQTIHPSDTLKIKQVEKAGIGASNDPSNPYLLAFIGFEWKKDILAIDDKSWDTRKCPWRGLTKIAPSHGTCRKKDVTLHL